MLDIQFIREHVDLVKHNIANRNMEVATDELLRLDEERRSRIVEIETFRSERNKKSKEKPREEEMKRIRKMGEKMKKVEQELEAIEKRYTDILLNVPNLAHADVPIGKDETENKVVRTVGDIPSFSFAPKEHWEIGLERNFLDFDHASDVSGSRFAYIKGDLVLLQFALIQFVLSVVTSEKTLQKIIQTHTLNVPSTPFIPVIPPVMMREEIMQKMGRLEPREERYHIPSDNLYLVGSAEHTLGPLHMREIIGEEKLPIRYIGYSTAFRREAGSYGKDTKGILRVHQFDKLEFESFSTPEKGEHEQDFIIAIQEYLMGTLGIPYRVILKCTGDMSAPDYREFDIEAWLPGQEKYRETHTSDYMTDYQSRRLNTRVKRKNKTHEFVHMNDATACAIGRTLIAIMENYQQVDGTIAIPTALHPYMIGKTSI